MYFGIDNQYIPQLMQSFETEFKAAWQRISQVISDEIEVVKFEAKQGISFGWQPLQDSFQLSSDHEKCLDGQLPIQYQYKYPGNRNICKRYFPLCFLCGTLVSKKIYFTKYNMFIYLN